MTLMFLNQGTIQTFNSTSMSERQKMKTDRKIFSKYHFSLSNVVLLSSKDISHFFNVLRELLEAKTSFWSSSLRILPRSIPQFRIRPFPWPTYLQETTFMSKELWLYRVLEQISSFKIGNLKAKCCKYAQKQSPSNKNRQQLKISYSSHLCHIKL